MSLPTVDLDDRTFANLFAEAQSVVPAHAPGWTNHNVSDPGITLVELFAWLAEMLVYRTNQVPDAHRIAFLRLLRGPEWQPTGDLDAEIQAALAQLRRRSRAVTPEDYAALAGEASPNVGRVRVVPRRNLLTGRDTDSPGDVSVIVLRGVGPNVLARNADGLLVDLTVEARSERGMSFGVAPAPGQELYVGSVERFHGVELVLGSAGSGYRLALAYWNGDEWAELGEPHVLRDGTEGLSTSGSVTFDPPDPDWVPHEVGGLERYWVSLSTSRTPSRVAQAQKVVPDDRLVQRVDAYLEERRILGTSHYVLEPEFVPVTTDLVVVRRSDVLDEDARAAAIAAIESFLDPLSGGPAGTGWPFGRSVYVSELHELLRSLAEIDHVADLRLAAAPGPDSARAQEVWHESGEQVGLDIGPHGLPEADLDPERIWVAARSLGLIVRAAVAPRESVSRAAVTRAVKDAVREFFHPDRRPLERAVLTPGVLRGPVEESLAVLGTLEEIELDSDPARTGRDEVLDVVTVRVEEGELVVPVVAVTLVEAS